MKIVWQTQSQILYQSLIEGKLTKNATGGQAYGYHAFQSLASKYNVVPDRIAVRRNENILLYWLRLSQHHTETDIIIKDTGVMNTGSMKDKAKKICILHHLDYDLKKVSLFYKWYFNRMEKLLKSADLVITVSEYWKERLSSVGIGNIRIIYNSFNPIEYKFDQDDLRKFIHMYSLDTGKPIIYIGNAKINKGTEHVYAALKNHNYTLVMSGSYKNALNIPVKHLNLERSEYLMLLAACDVVLTMSTMFEGWNRTAHEALLCKTPVIGSGMGGMYELLHGAGQIIESDFSKLPLHIEEVLNARQEYALKGHEFVKTFNLKYFLSEWDKAVTSIL